MRGKEEVVVYTEPENGITPAYAGKSFYFIRMNEQDRDHPRVCGEKRDLAQMRMIPVGSPPRMRGKVRQRTDFAKPTGITPAYAGKSHHSGHQHGKF